MPKIILKFIPWNTSRFGQNDHGDWAFDASVNPLRLGMREFSEEGGGGQTL
jgi:hypothetical protein